MKKILEKTLEIIGVAFVCWTVMFMGYVLLYVFG